MVTPFQPADPPEVFISYAYKDEDLLEEFLPHLASLEIQKIITCWHARKMVAGEDWHKTISEHLNTARIVLLLVSKDFLASDYCYGVEFKLAMERHADRAARVIPVILRTCSWKATPLGSLHALPKRAKPVVKWDDIEEAFVDVSAGITEAVKDLELGRVEKPITDPPVRDSRAGSLRAFPVLRYALVIGSITAAAAIGPGSRIDSKPATLVPLIMLALMFGLVSFSWVVRHSTAPVKRLALTLASISLLLSASTSMGIFLVYFSSPRPAQQIEILVTEIPPYEPDGGTDSHGHIAGRVEGARSPEFCLVIYSLTTSWYVQPRANDFETRINPDGGWSADIQTGTKYAVLLVRPKFPSPFRMSESPTRMDGIVTSIEVEGKKVKDDEVQK